MVLQKKWVEKNIFHEYTCKVTPLLDMFLMCKFSKLQYNSLTFVAGLNRATDEGSLPEIAQYSPYCFQSIKTLYFICYYCSWCCAVWRP